LPQCTAASDPEAPGSIKRETVRGGLRSLHLRNVPVDDPSASVRRPVHLIYFRIIRPGLIEIARILHERMDPARHLPDE
jgi:toxin ParE1/3/4